MDAGGAMTNAAVTAGEIVEVAVGGFADKSVVVVGAGATGSHVIQHVGRMRRVGCTRVIDRDSYDRSNLRGQAIRSSDVGKAKARVQARRLREMNPSLVVEAYVASLEELPYGVYDADLIISCLDSRLARLHLSQIATRLGVPWIDTGVDAGGLLARVNAYDPREEGAACYGCALSSRDYDNLETAYPCQGAGDQAPATNAPSALGGLAGALTALEIEKWLDEKDDRLPAGREVMFNAASHEPSNGGLRRAASCRCDHEVWDIRPLAENAQQLTIGAALGLPQRDAAAASPGYELPEATLSVPGQSFVERLTCVHCDVTREVCRLVSRLRPADLKCPGCGVPSTPVGFDQVSRIRSSRVSPRAATQPVSSLGLRAGDVITVARAGVESHYLLGRADAATHKVRAARAGRG